MEKRKNRTALFILLLLLMLFIAWYLIVHQTVVLKTDFVQQGSTTVKGSPEINLWDYSAVDGDTIDFYFDGKLIFKNLGLGDTPVVYKTTNLSKGEHWIGIRAVTEGTNPPATPHISVMTENEKAEFDVDSWKDSASGSWIIKVE